MVDGGPQWKDFPRVLHPYIELVPGISARVVLNIHKDGQDGFLDIMTVNHTRGLQNDPSRLRETHAAIQRVAGELLSTPGSASFLSEAHPRRALFLSADRRILAEEKPHVFRRQEDFTLALDPEISDEGTFVARQISAHNLTAPPLRQIHIGSVDPANLTTLVLLERSGFPEEVQQLYLLVRELSGHVGAGFDLEDPRLALRLQTLSDQLGGVDWLTLDRAEELFQKAIGKPLREELSHIGEYFLHNKNRPGPIAEVANFAEQRIRDPFIGHQASRRMAVNHRKLLLYGYAHLSGIANHAAAGLRERGYTVRVGDKHGPPFPGTTGLLTDSVLTRHRTPTVEERFPDIPIDPRSPRSPAFQRLAYLARSPYIALTGWTDSPFSLTPKFPNEDDTDLWLPWKDETQPTARATCCVEFSIFDAISFETSTLTSPRQVATYVLHGAGIAALHFDHDEIEDARRRGLTATVGVIAANDDLRLNTTNRCGWLETPKGQRILATQEVDWDDLSHILPRIAPVMSLEKAAARMRSGDPEQVATFAFDPYSGRSVHPENWRVVSDLIMTNGELPERHFSWTLT